MTTTKQSHPPGLYTLFFTEMWERFSYYGMRALLVLYLTSQIITGGFELDRTSALEIYALFTGLVYLTPILGGLLADKVLGQRKAIYIGGFLMALGQMFLSLSVGAQEAAEVGASREFLLNMGLGLLIMGNGFFKPNISTIVGALYEENDPRKDSGFTIFYMGINLGAFFSPLICGTLGETVGWEYGFGAAALGMLLGLVWFALRAETLGNIGFPPKMNVNALRLGIKDWGHIGIYILVNFVAVYAFIELWGALTESIKNALVISLAVLGTLGILFIVFKNTNGSNEWSRVRVIFILAFFNIFFWAGFEQAGGTFNLFAAENTDRSFFSMEIPASYFQSVNAIFIFALAPVFSTLWIVLGRRGKNPNTPAKFALGLILLGAGFLIMNIAWNLSADGNLVSPFWLIAVYMTHTLGELCLSPIGLSMITKLSPPKIVSVMMGLWFSSIALANYMAGILENLLHTLLPDLGLFNFLTLTSLAAGVLLYLLSPKLKSMMRGID